MDVAEFEAAGLYDPRAPNAAERLALLEWLAARGVTIDQMVRAQRETSLQGLAADLARRGGPRLTLAEVAQQMGVAPARVEEIVRAAGFPPLGPDEAVFGEEDVRTFVAFSAAAVEFGDLALRRFVRVLGSSLARVADAANSLFLLSVEGPMRAAGGGELAIAQATLRAIERLETLPVVLNALFRAHMEIAIRRSREARRGADVETARLTVGFVDLVGFTPLSRHLSARDLGAVVDRFEDRAHEVVTAHDGRVVKLIGDEVMFVTVRAAAACSIALELVEGFASDGSITPRGGLATGDLLVRGGDCYGPVVNLASRVAQLAVPRELLVTPEVAAEAAGAGLRFEPAGKRLPKGFDEPVTLLTVERAG